MGQNKTRTILGSLSAKIRQRQNIHPSALIDISDAVGGFRGRLSVGEDSSLTVEDGAVVDCDVVIGERSSVVLHRNSRLVGAVVEIGNDARVELGEGGIIDSPTPHQSSVFVDNGSFILGEFAHVMSSDVLVRFGGRMTIGRYTGIAYRSEIRCEEEVHIGAYGMLSYDVCIYDTNTHSTDWRERRRMIEQCYPGGVSEIQKPSTKPVLIGDDVWIGKEVTITKGAIIGNRCIIGIRSAIGGETVPDDSVVVPAKPRIITRNPGESGY